MRILVYGLPGSGKSTLAKVLARRLKITWINADEVRRGYHDWDFTLAGRERQLRRMMALSNAGDDCICDFVCPFENGRKRFGADFSIWMNTITTDRYGEENTFQKPERADLIITTFDYDLDKVLQKIVCTLK